MYVVTFYSFKGGTGRTMGLVNVAAALSRAGSRVLLVDFDLEAPGLDTFACTECNPAQPGLVDFILDYTATADVPDVTDYVHTTPPNEFGGQLLVMPAGRQDAKYDQRFRLIDWNYLYEHQDGFVVFEDMKEQWRKTLRADYVLIDSRTGHTDIGGICTRHLPDAVVVMIFPNDQNRRGLKPIVEAIRAEKSGPQSKAIQLHFVPSNVPDLDDEEHILADHVDRIKAELQIDEFASVIHHYSSLLLVNQAVFTVERPRSRLAQEYEKLVQAIRRANVEDKIGAEDYLADVSRLLMSRRPPAPQQLEERIERILDKHSFDGEILRTVSRIRRRQLRDEEALSLLDRAVSIGVNDSDILLARVEVNTSLGRRSHAIEDLRVLLRQADIPAFDLSVVVSRLVELAPNLAHELLHSPAADSLDADGIIPLAVELQTLRQTLPVAETLLKRALGRGSDADRAALRHELQLCLIGEGRYSEAIGSIADGLQFEDLELADAFNYAMATWGEWGEAPREQFVRVLSLGDHSPSLATNPNFCQCMALAHWAVGRIDEAGQWAQRARSSLTRSRRPVFSAWSYLYRKNTAFLKDIATMERMFAGDQMLPDFMTQDAGREL